MSPYRSQLRLVGVPLTLTLCTYVAVEPPLICSVPLGRVIVMDGNSGPCSASTSAPGVGGYMPRADHTYQADVAPRSSLPGRPPGPVVNDSLITRRTAELVPCGGPA